MNNITNNFNIYQYNEENLLKALKNDHIYFRDIRTKKRHFEYFKEYFSGGTDDKSQGLGAGLILIEKNYISRSYLDDYQEHYILAYGSYPKECDRIHFFQHSVTKDEVQNKERFLESIFGDTVFSSQFWDGYLGYFVKRPIPRGIIGATLLKSYPEIDEGVLRRYTATTNYDINIFGKKKSLNTLIYVEQDTIVGACATSALYVAFHKLSQLFNTPRPNQKKISDAAGISVNAPNRKLKNKQGLRPFQMCKAIEYFGLEPELQDFAEEDFYSIKAYLYAYLKMGLPIILGVDIEDAGLHAITLVGYQEVNSESIEIEPYNLKKGCSISFNSKIQNFPLNLKGGFLKRLYAHDDQIGPFARIGFNDEKRKLISAWWYEDKGINHKRLADIFIAITPLSNRIRIPFESVYRQIGYLNNWFHETIENLDQVMWDVYLNFSNTEKEDIQAAEDYKFNLHSNFLTTTMPKYIWVADFYISGLRCFKVIFDASEIDEDFFAKEVIYFSDEIFEFFKDYFDNAINQELLESNNEFAEEALDKLGIKMINLFRRSLGLSILNIGEY